MWRNEICQVILPAFCRIPADSPRDRIHFLGWNLLSPGVNKSPKKNIKQQIDDLDLIIISLSGTMPPVLEPAREKQKTVRVCTTDQKRWLIELRDKNPWCKHVIDWNGRRTCNVCKSLPSLGNSGWRKPRSGSLRSTSWVRQIERCRLQSLLTDILVRCAYFLRRN